MLLYTALLKSYLGYGLNIIDIKSRIRANQEERSGEYPKKYLILEERKTENRRDN